MSILKTDFLKFGEDLYEVVPPTPSEEDRGGVIASPATEAETIEAKLGDDGKLYVGADAKGSAAAALSLANENTQTKIDELSDAIDGKLAGKADTAHNHAIADVNGLQAELDEKADSSDLTPLTSHVANDDIHVTQAEKDQWSAAEPNQNAFSTIIGSNGSEHNAGSASGSFSVIGADGITVSIGAGKDADQDITIYNDGVLEVATGTSNGTISVDGTDVAVKGLGTAAYENMTDIQASIDAKADASALAGKADADHEHDASEIAFESSTKELTGDTVLEVLENADLVISNMVTDIENKADKVHSHVASDITDIQTKLDSTLESSKGYTDEKVALLLNNSSAAVDSIMELATAMEENEEVVGALEQAIGNKADKTHTHDDRYYTETEIDTKLDTKADVNALSNKADKVHNHDDKYYTEVEIDAMKETMVFIDEDDNEDIADPGSSATIAVDSALSTTSTNPVQNKAVTNEIRQIQEQIADLYNPNISRFDGYNIPRLTLTGDVTGMSKEVEKTLNYTCLDKDGIEKTGTCTLKWQGSSSLTFDKKNYTIKFDNAFEVVSGWGSQKKYVLKANFVDFSHARNVVCAKLWGKIVKARTTVNTTLNVLPNGGAIDGFPIILSLNGKFHGLYTWNIPKDAWMFGMDGTGQQAILCAERNNNEAVAFKALATFEKDSNGEFDFEVEYSSDEQTDWILESLNRLISEVKDSDGTNITNVIGQYLDWDSAIDYFIHTVLTDNYDGVWRNYLLSTYDGVKWFFTGYDMDVVLGLRSLGKYFYAADVSTKFTDVANMHKVFGLIWKYMRPQLRDRYNALRESVMAEHVVANEFMNFVNDIPLPIYTDDARLWKSIPSSSANNLSTIINYYNFRCKIADEWITSTSGETELPEQVNPDGTTFTNQVPISIASDGSIYNDGLGYKNGYRLSSSGSESEMNTNVITGFIKAKAGDTIRIKGSNWCNTDVTTNYLIAYDSNFAKVYTGNPQKSYETNTFVTSMNYDETTGISTVVLKSGFVYEYIRISLYYGSSPDGANLIVTVNEEIS